MNMDIIAKRIVRRYVEEHLDKSDKEIALTQKEPYFVWKCKTLQNWKYLLSTDLHDGMYYELTYNGDKETPKKPILYTDVIHGEEKNVYECPNCASFLGYEDECKEESYQSLYCSDCGQRLDWMED